MCCLQKYVFAGLTLCPASFSCQLKNRVRGILQGGGVALKIASLPRQLLSTFTPGQAAANLFSLKSWQVHMADQKELHYLTSLE